MNNVEISFFSLLSKLFDSDKNDMIFPSSCDEWKTLYKISKAQKLWPVIFEQVCNSKEYLALAGDLQLSWMQDAVSNSAGQIIQTKELCRICDALKKENVEYVILKGISCRRYYPNPNSRPSGDEDILINWQDYKKCDAILLENGYQCENNFEFNDIQNKREAHYIHKDGLLYLEVHFNAIGKENQRQLRLNETFDDALSHTMQIEYDGCELNVLEPTYQIMHLISHFYRHLYESGVGIRQMIDILMTICAESSAIDWNVLGNFLKRTKMRKIFSAVLNTGKKYFNIDLSFVPKDIWQETVNEEPMLEDMFNGGIYGHGENGERRLSNNFTLDIDTTHSTAINILFPPKQRLADRYPILDKYPFLYPVYVVVRWFELLKSYGANKKTRAMLKKRIEVGKERKDILEQYKD